MTLTKHQNRKIAKLQYLINYFCGEPCFEKSPIIETTSIENSETILISIRNAPGSRWYESRINFWAYITPRGKIQYIKNDLINDSKSIYDKHFKRA
jgi:hypothetical protein